MATDADRVLSVEMPWHDRQALRVHVASALAAVGLCEKAEAIARHIADPDHKDDVLADIARALAETGQPDRAIDVSRKVLSNWNLARALTGIAAALADTDPERATRLAWHAATAARKPD